MPDRVLEDPPDPFEHPLNSASLPLRLWVATKRILFLVHCFTPFAVVTVVYLLYDTPEMRCPNPDPSILTGVLVPERQAAGGWQSALGGRVGARAGEGRLHFPEVRAVDVHAP